MSLRAARLCRSRASERHDSVDIIIEHCSTVCSALLIYRFLDGFIHRFRVRISLCLNIVPNGETMTDCHQTTWLRWHSISSHAIYRVAYLLTTRVRDAMRFRRPRVAWRATKTNFHLVREKEKNIVVHRGNSLSTHSHRHGHLSGCGT